MAGRDRSLILAVLYSTAACGPGDRSTSSTPAAAATCVAASETLRSNIERQLAQHEFGKRTRDVALTVSVLADSVQIWNGSSKPIRGREALAALNRDLFRTVRFDSINYALSDVRDCGAVILELGEARAYYTPLGQPSRVEHDRYLHTWEQRDGSWQLTLAVNQEMAPTSPASSAPGR